MAEALRDSKHYGFATPDNTSFDFGAFKKKRDEHIRDLNAGYEKNWSREGIGENCFLFLCSLVCNVPLP